MAKRAHQRAIFEDTLARLAALPAHAEAISQTRLYDTWPPVAPWPGVASAPTVYHWADTTTLQATQRLTTLLGTTVCALNFASARHPGGGVEKGASAQEESLCRASGLWPCLAAQPTFYQRHQAHPAQGLYQEMGLFSPAVVVLKDDAGQLLATPYQAHFLTMPAVNAKEARRHQLPAAFIRAAMATRLESVLALAVHCGQRHLVLGAYGCGVFGNVVEEVAVGWQTLLAGPYRGYFTTVVFATIDPGEHQAFVHAFGAHPV